MTTTTATKTTGASKREILELCRKEAITFLRLQFTDILGVNKNVEVPESQFEKALEGDIMFDGSSIEGFVRIEESDMVLKPDLATFRILPYDDEGGKVVVRQDRKSTRLNSSHLVISYAVFCLKKKTNSESTRSMTDDIKALNSFQ